MACAAHRWTTTAPNAPLLARAAFALTPASRARPERSVAPHPRDDVHRVFEAVRRRGITRRAVLVQ